MKILGLLMACSMAAFAAGEAVLIQNADIYPITGAPLKGGSLLIQDGKIVDIGMKIVAPKGAMVLDVKGLRVYPGWIDSATELGLEEIGSIRETNDTGEIGDFEPQLRALSAVNPESEHFGAVKVNGITTAVTFPALGGRGGGGGAGGQLISGQAALLHTEGWTWEEMSINRSVAMVLNFPSAGGGGRRGGGGGPPDVQDIFAGATGANNNAQRAVLDQIAKLNSFFDDARKYQKAKAANPPDFRKDLRFEAMLPVLEGKMPLTISAARANTIHDAIAWSEKQNVKIVIMQPREIAKAGPELKAKNVPIVLGRVLALPENEDAEYDQGFTQPLEAYKAGVKFSLGTFTNEFVRDLPYQAATAVAFGLPHDEALKALTINPAQIWGAGDLLGSLEKGKLADLMIVDGDPMDVRTQIRHIFVNGKEITLSNKQIRLYEKYMGRQ